MLKITLRAARELCGYTKETASKKLGISKAVYNTYENDPGIIPKITACKIKKMYGISLDLIRMSVGAYSWLLALLAHANIN